MSHHKVVYSPAGTPLPQRTVGELVAERPGRSRIFQNYQIDFCCQGGRTLAEACKNKGVALDDVVRRIEAEQAEPAEGVKNPAELATGELITYIVERHHGFLKQELPRLHAMAHRVAQVHGPHTPSLVEVYEVFIGMFRELDDHMRKEEEVLFPAIRKLSEEGTTVLDLGSPIACMMHEHEDTGKALERLRELTHGFQPPAEACNTYRALFDGLKDLEDDMHHHIHLENSVLFPTAERLMAA
jgi:regulator of cell morphogenesis and NO signaling